MIKIIVFTIVFLLFVQFVLYYCNVDLFKMYIKNEKEKDNSENFKELDESKERLKTFINELKQYDNII